MKKTCRECGEFKEHKAKGLCNKCYKKNWRIENPKKQKVQEKRYRLKHSEKLKARSRNYYLENSKKERARSRNYYLENPEKEKARHRKYRLENLEKVKAKRRAYCKKYQRENPIKRRELNLKRRGYGIIEKGIIDRIITENILKYGEIVCEKCKEKCPDNFHVDHIRPLSKGGSNDHSNLQILCAHCNCSKATETADYKEAGQRQQLFLRI